MARAQPRLLILFWGQKESCLYPVRFLRFRCVCFASWDQYFWSRTSSRTLCLPPLFLSSLSPSQSLSTAYRLERRSPFSEQLFLALSFLSSFQPALLVWNASGRDSSVFSHSCALTTVCLRLCRQDTLQSLRSIWLFWHLSSCSTHRISWAEQLCSLFVFLKHPLQVEIWLMSHFFQTQQQLKLNWAYSYH